MALLTTNPAEPVTPRRRSSTTDRPSCGQICIGLATSMQPSAGRSKTRHEGAGAAGAGLRSAPLSLSSSSAVASCTLLLNSLYASNPSFNEPACPRRSLLPRRNSLRRNACILVLLVVLEVLSFGVNKAGDGRKERPSKKRRAIWCSFFEANIVPRGPPYQDSVRQQSRHSGSSSRNSAFSAGLWSCIRANFDKARYRPLTTLGSGFVMIRLYYLVVCSNFGVKIAPALDVSSLAPLFSWCTKTITAE